MSVEPESLSMKQLCVLAGISLSTLYQRFKDGDGPPTFRIGVKSRRVRRETALEWLRQLEERDNPKGRAA